MASSVNKWKIYYSDSTFSSEEGTPRDAPFWDVQDIIQFDTHMEKKYHQNHADYYTFRDGFWVGVDFVGLIDYLAHYRGEYVVKVGRTIPTKRWNEIFNTARADDFIK
jgi:hypothetical protein